MTATHHCDLCERATTQTLHRIRIPPDADLVLLDAAATCDLELGKPIMVLRCVCCGTLTPITITDGHGNPRAESP